MRKEGGYKKGSRGTLFGKGGKKVVYVFFWFSDVFFTKLALLSSYSTWKLRFHTLHWKKNHIQQFILRTRKIFLIIYFKIHHKNIFAFIIPYPASSQDRIWRKNLGYTDISSHKPAAFANASAYSFTSSLTSHETFKSLKLWKFNRYSIKLHTESTCQ